MMNKEFDYSTLKHCGTDVRIASTVFIKSPHLVSIGNHVAIDGFCFITTALELGDYIHIGPFCSIIGGIQANFMMKDFTGMAAGCRVICASDDYLGRGLTNPMIPPAYRAKIQFAPVIMEKHALLGTNCVVHPGVRIGEGVAVGSCSLVTKDLEPWQIYMGIPAKPKKARDRQRLVDLEARLRAEVR